MDKNKGTKRWQTNSRKTDYVGVVTSKLGRYIPKH